jgi:zinc transport system substrate-binding protein
VRFPFLTALLAALLGLSGHAAAEPRVVASIQPVHSLVAAVMDGVAEPALLVRGQSSPHSYAMRPSDAAALDRAELVFWVGPELEAFLSRPLLALAGRAEVVALLAADGVQRLPVRSGADWQRHQHAEGGATEHEGAWDGHIWLDPRNAAAIARIAAAALQRHDPAHADRYAANLAGLEARLAALDGELSTGLAPLDGRPFVVFHDAFQYLEHRYGLTALGAILPNPEQRPSAARMAALRRDLVDRQVRCVFSEPQFEPALVTTLVADTAVRQGTLDPEGAALPPGPALYFDLMRANARALAGCLGGK